MGRHIKRSLKFTSPSNESTEKGMWGPGQSSQPYPRRIKDLQQIYTTSEPQNKLDTDIFQQYLEFMWSDFPKHKVQRCAFLDCLWFNAFVKGQTAKVISWAKCKRIFSTMYTFVPIVGWGHWNLLILRNFGEDNESAEPCMLLLDSLMNADPLKVEPEIRRFLVELFKAEGYSIPLLLPKVPQQRNNKECGIFVLFYIYLFVQSASPIFTQDDYKKMLTERWFKYHEVDAFEKKIRSIVSCCHRKRRLD